MEFSELELHPDIRRGIDEAGYVTCTPVQAAVFHRAFQGDDIYAQSQTGTGKTAAFLVSIFQRIMTIPDQRTRKVLVLTPTRELAVQIEGEAKKLGKHLPISSGAFFGGVSYGPQVDMLRDNVQMIIGTPGRIIDLVKQGKMLLREVGFLVIDEADRMFDMGFIDDLRKLIRYLPPPTDRQTFLFSATLGLRVKDLAWEYMVEPHEVSIEPEHVTVDLVTQELHHVGTHEKLRLLLGILDRERPESCIVFCNQKVMVEQLARRLKINGFECEYIMGDLPQSKRLEIIEKLKAKELKLLVATDVAARGLDVDALDLVVNYDIPEDAESYVHRIGRTARAGKAGKAITLACEKFVFGLPAIEKYLGQKIPVAGYDPALMLEDRSAHLRFSRYGDRDRDGGRGRDDRRGRDGGRSRDGGRGREGGRGYERRDERPAGRGRDERRPREELAAGTPRQDEERRPPRRERRAEPAVAEGGEFGQPVKEGWQEPRTEAGGRRDGRRPEGPKSEGTRPESRRDGRRDGRRPGGAGAEGARLEGSPERAAPQGRRPEEARDPYAMSQDERLKRFKDKYAKGEEPRKGTEPRPAEARRPARRGPAETPAAAKAEAPSKKPGLLDRIKGLFTKKS